VYREYRICKFCRTPINILYSFSRRLSEDGDLSLRHVGVFKFMYSLWYVLCRYVGVCKLLLGLHLWLKEKRITTSSQPILYLPTFLSFLFQLYLTSWPSGVPRNFFSGGGSTNSVEDRGQRERGSGGGSPLVRGSGGSCNLIQEISFHIINVS
jgi:hypothetical protein